MADVQKEKGFVPIADELLSALLRSHVPLTHQSVMLAVMDKTYGWQKRAGRVSVNWIAKFSDIDRHNVQHALIDLERWGMIERQAASGNQIRIIAVVKDYDLWVIPEAGSRSHHRRPCAPGGNPPPCVPGYAAPPCVPRHAGPACLGTHQPACLGTHKKKKKSLRTAAASAASPARPSMKKVKPKTYCPERLEPEERDEVRAWRDTEYPEKFSDAELNAQWVRFYRWNAGKKIRNAEWVLTFYNWLTGPKYEPLTNRCAGAAIPAVPAYAPGVQRSAEYWDGMERSWSEARESYDAERKAARCARSAAP